MRDLAVFDFDGTLIPGDSFSDLCRAIIWHNPRLFVLGVGRRIRFVRRARFAEAAHRAMLPILDETFLTNFVSLLTASIAAERLAVAHAWRRKGAYTLLLSASPHPYISRVALELGLDAGVGSNWQNGVYRHLYGPNKRTFLDEAYPSDCWNRLYATGDSSSDLPLLAAFQQGELVDPLFSSSPRIIDLVELAGNANPLRRR